MMMGIHEVLLELFKEVRTLLHCVARSTAGFVIILSFGENLTFGTENMAGSSNRTWIESRIDRCKRRKPSLNENDWSP